MAHRICARLGAGHLRALLARMMAVVPDPLSARDRSAGFDWSFSIAQLEVSDTAVFDQPRRARAWFEAAIGDHLDLGRPERVSLLVDRTVRNRGKNKTPGRFATEVITRDTAPQLQIHYKSSKAKAYLKEGRALRVETTVNNASDFALHKTLSAENWNALRRAGADTNARFLATLGEGRPGLPDPATLESIVLPSVHDGQRAPGLRFGDPRTMALLGSIAAFAHVIGGLTNKSLRTQMTAHWRTDYSSAQASYDLRRLRLKGLIERVQGTNTYRVTSHGLRVSAFFTQLASRVDRPSSERLGRPRATLSTGASPTHCSLANLRTRARPRSAHGTTRCLKQNLPQLFRTRLSSGATPLPRLASLARDRGPLRGSCVTSEWSLPFGHGRRSFHPLRRPARRLL